MFKSIDEQLSIIKRGVLEIVREEELVEKLKKSINTQTPMRVKLGLEVWKVQENRKPGKKSLCKALKCN